MAYDTYENSWADGNPIELYTFEMGSETWYYTSASESVTYLANIYLPAMIKRDSLSQSNEKIKNQLTLSVHRSASFANQFIAYPPEQNIEFTLFRGHGTDYVTYWKGNVGEFSFSDDAIQLTIVPPHRGSTMSSLRRKYQVNCTYPLYSEQCLINSVLWQVAGTILTNSVKTITATEFATKPDDWFTGGKIVSGTTQRLITSHTGSTITVVLPTPLIDAGDSFIAYAGCPHSYEECGSKFSNKINFGGQPWLPDKNPFVGDGVE